SRPVSSVCHCDSRVLLSFPTRRSSDLIHYFSWSGVRRYLEPWFAAEAFPFSNEEKKEEAQKKFLGKLAGARQKRAIGAYPAAEPDRKSTRLNSSHVSTSYAVFCLKKKN